jgi:hypothetical protein
MGLDYCIRRQAGESDFCLSRDIALDDVVLPL